MCRFPLADSARCLTGLSHHLASLVALLCLSANSGWAQQTDIPTDAQLLQQRAKEIATGFVVAVPPSGTEMRPVQRVPRDRFGVVGPFPLKLEDLDALVYPDADREERAALLEGMVFFTTPHVATEGAGPVANQQSCLGCHTSSAEAITHPGLVGPATCIPGSTCVSLASRAARATPTNFNFTALDPATGGGRAADHLDAMHDTGQTAAFTVFGDFSPSLDVFDPLDGVFINPVTMVAQQFGGLVQHTRPSLPACLPDRIPPISADVNLAGTPDVSGLYPSGFRRTVGERAGPPYIGRGLMEAIPTDDILANEDPQDVQGHRSSLRDAAASLGCAGDCVSGIHNEIPATGEFVGGVGRFGLRSNGVEILQFSVGGLQGELGFTSALNGREINLPDIDIGRPGCVDTVPEPEAGLVTVFSERNFIRNTAPPEFGKALLRVLGLPNPNTPLPPGTREGRVQRGARLFGIDLRAFANRMIPGRMPSGGDHLDPNAINQRDRMLNCAGCHTPVQRTGQSPADVGARHLSFVWAPVFSDLLLHRMPAIDAERFASTPRAPLLIRRPHGRQAEERGRGDDNREGAGELRRGHLVDTFDLSRNLADDAFSNQKGTAKGQEFRTAPLMALGRMGPPFLHDARVYLSALTVDTTPASTVMTNREVTNAPLVVRTLDDAIRAAIELHDLPPPDDDRTPDVPGAGCPVPPAGEAIEELPGADVVCPPYESDTSRIHRSDSREAILRFRELGREDQQALIEFLKQL